MIDMETKRELYELLCEQVRNLVQGEDNEMGVLANVAAAMHEAFPTVFFWV